MNGQELWNKAKKILPGGSQLLSKRCERFLPGQWPAYYSKAKGIEVWDLDGIKYTDMCIMGIGACILGYADEDVDSAVKKRIDTGSMNTLNCPEEVELAEKLLKLNKWAGGVRYTRTGGESIAVAIRIARAHTKKDKIAFCGYHGWSDWYLAANLGKEDRLGSHLIKGLKPTGVPKGLEGTAIPFHYNKIEELEKIIEENKGEIGVICMEVIRDKKPEDGFLQKVRKIADEIGAVLIFDEITSAFRLSIGGIYKKYGVEPDIIVFGKAIGNGYPMGAIVGKGEIMDIAQESFISSTFWTEGIGPTAALATIEKLERVNAPKHIEEIGNKVEHMWGKLGEENGLNIHSGTDFPALAHFEFKDENSNAIKTLFTQMMLERNYLASTGLYVSYSHKQEDIEKYGEIVNEVFGLLKNAVDRQSVEKQLKGPEVQFGFERLT